MALVTDLSGIRKLIEPLEASGRLVRRTDEEVCDPALPYLILTFDIIVLKLLKPDSIFKLMLSHRFGLTSYLKLWIHLLLWREKARSLLVLPCFLS